MLEVDHIKPRSTHPELALDFDNLQVLCHDCNQGKGNRDDFAWRSATPESRDTLAMKLIRSAKRNPVWGLSLTIVALLMFGASPSGILMVLALGLILWWTSGR